VRIAALDGVVQCRPDIIGDTSEPRPLLLTEAALQRPVGKVPALIKHPGQVAGPHRLELTVLCEQRSPVVPDQDEQPVPGLAVGQLGQGHEGAVDEVTQPVQDVERVGCGLLNATESFRGLQAERPANHRKAAEQEPLGLAQRLVAPLQQRPNRLVARMRSARTAGEQAQPVGKPTRELPQGEVAQPRGGQLQGEREPVEIPADLRHDRKGGRVQREIGPGGARSIGEQQRRARGLPPVQVLVIPIGHGQRRDAPDPFPWNTQRLSGGGEQPECAAAAQQAIDEPSDLIGDALAVVDHQQHVPIHQPIDQGLLDRGPGLVPDAEGVGHAKTYVRAVYGIGEQRHPDTVAEPLRAKPSELKRQPGLADASRAHHRHQPLLVEEPSKRLDLGLATDKGREQGGHIMGGSRNGTRRWEPP
jgi:hypothetical protein